MYINRKLTDLDSWSQVCVHVASDMTVIKDDLGMSEHTQTGLDNSGLHKSSLSLSPVELVLKTPFTYYTGKVCVEEEANPVIKTKSHPSGLLLSDHASHTDDRDPLKDYQVMSMSNLPAGDSSTAVSSSFEEMSTSNLPKQLMAGSLLQSYANIGKETQCHSLTCTHRRSRL